MTLPRYQVHEDACTVDLLGVILDGGFFDIVRKIQACWGEPECESYLSKLVLQDRVDRQGFPPQVFSAIMDVQTLHSGVFGQRRGDVWSSACGFEENCKRNGNQQGQPTGATH